MTKRLTQLFFVAFMVTAGWLLIFKKSNLQYFKDLSHVSGAHLITLKDFVSKRFVDSIQVAQLSSKVGYFNDRSVLNLQGDVQGYRIVNQNDRQEFFCQELQASYKSSSGKEIHEQALERVDLYRNVQLKLPEYTLLTEFARYHVVEELIISPEPLEMLGEKRNLKGSNGFRFDLLTRNFEIFGSIIGYFEPKPK